MSSDKDPEVSPGGSTMLRYGDVSNEWVRPAESIGAEAIERHVARFWGEPSFVFHEILSSRIHLDVHIIPPRPERDVWTLFTTGMSDLPMSTPPQFKDRSFAELVLVLPPTWKVGELKATPPPPTAQQWYWPIQWLKSLARFPHEHETWLSDGHTIPNGDPPRAFVSGTQLCAWLLLPPVSVPDKARSVALPNGRQVRLHVLHALHRDELALKLAKGTDALLEAFDKAQVSETLIVDRPSTVRKKRFGLF
jgi:hypothetical protein